MTSQYRTFSVRARLAVVLVAGIAGSLLLSGCGLGANTVSDGGNIIAAGMTGKLTGGPNPIVGATVKLFTTGGSFGVNTGYGGAQQVQEANQVGPVSGQETDSNGSFSFAGGYYCPAGQYLYIESSGGNTGSGINSKATLVAALGRCDDLFVGGKYVGGFIYLNELSTVAAAYALGGFTSYTGTGFFTVVNIGAPTANNAATGCVANGTTCPTTAAAGLRHAFQNAANLVSPFAPFANSTLPQNSAARVPLQLINTIANSLVACVNSDGTGSACQAIFNATGTDFTSGTIFQVAANLAKNPTLAGTVTNAATVFYNAASPSTSYYQPMLSAAPTDYSIAILIPQATGATTGTQGLVFPVSGSLDINDNYYVGNYDSATPTKANAVSFKSDATLVSFTPDNTVDLDAASANVDAIGNLYTVGVNSGTGNGSISKFSINTTTGSISSSPAILSGGTYPVRASAVDKLNNLWFGNQPPTSVKSTISEVLAGQTTPAFSANTLYPIGAVGVDPNQNIWVTNLLPQPQVFVVSNVGTVAAPSYTGRTFLNYINGNDPSGITFVSGSPYTAYVTTTSSFPGITPITPTVTGNTVTGATFGGLVRNSFTSPTTVRTDGGGIIWGADDQDVGKYTPGATKAILLTPCIVPAVTTNTTCITTPYDGISSVSVDSAGSVWFTSAETGTVSEIIGAATPTWPLLPLGLFGKPQ